MEIRILYFARLRETVGCSEERCALPAEISNIGALRLHLAARGDEWKMLENGRAVRVALNQSMVTDDAQLHAGDEVAFFPPVTGG